MGLLKWSNRLVCEWRADICDDNDSGRSAQLTDRWSTQTENSNTWRQSRFYRLLLLFEIQYGSCGQLRENRMKNIPRVLAVFETITRLSISLMFFFRFWIAKMEKKNVVCALKNIKHRMNFTPYKLIDTTASRRSECIPEERKKWIDETVCATWVERTRNYCILCSTVFFFFSFHFKHFAQAKTHQIVLSFALRLLYATASLFMQWGKNELRQYSPRYCPTHSSPTHSHTHPHAVNAITKALKRRENRPGICAIVIAILLAHYSAVV